MKCIGNKKQKMEIELRAIPKTDTLARVQSRGEINGTGGQTGQSLLIYNLNLTAATLRRPICPRISRVEVFKMLLDGYQKFRT